jgi:hypothetical protein
MSVTHTHIHTQMAMDWIIADGAHTISEYASGTPSPRPQTTTDVSGSMQKEASIKTDDGDAEATGLNRLDIVKHAILTVLTSLSPLDELSIVSFSSEAKVVLPLTLMSEEGKAVATTQLKSLRPDCLTNLWAGISSGYRVLADAKPSTQEGQTRNKVILVLTDGLPNVCVHPDGEIAALDQHLSASPPDGNHTIVSTFGFGYELKSDLLLEISRRCGGGYTFVPDASFVGTAFVNAVSSCLTLFSPTVTVTIHPASGVTVVPQAAGSAKGVYPQINHGDGSIELSLGPLHLGQPRDAVVELSAIKWITAGTTEAGLIGRVVVAAAGCPIVEMDFGAGGDPTLAEVQRLRLDVCAAIEADAMQPNRVAGSCPTVDTVIADTAHSLAAAHPAVVALREDLTGQIKEAMSAAYFDSWGLHYLRSLGRSHLLQQCANFKVRGRVGVRVSPPPPSPSPHSSVQTTIVLPTLMMCLIA